MCQIGCTPYNAPLCSHFLHSCSKMFGINRSYGSPKTPITWNLPKSRSRYVERRPMPSSMPNSWDVRLQKNRFLGWRPPNLSPLSSLPCSTGTFPIRFEGALSFKAHTLNSLSLFVPSAINRQLFITRELYSTSRFTVWKYFRPMCHRPCIGPGSMGS